MISKALEKAITGIIGILLLVALFMVAIIYIVAPGLAANLVYALLKTWESGTTSFGSLPKRRD